MVKDHGNNILTTLYFKFKGLLDAKLTEAKVALVAIKFAVEMSFRFLHV